MDTFRTNQVFTPTTPARLTFVERDSLNDQLVDALETPGKQVVVYGPSGSGKTTLLVNKLHQLYPHHLTTRCTINSKYDDIIIDAFDQLDPYYRSSITNKESSTLKGNIGAEYLSIKSALQASISTESSNTLTRALPPQLTASKLASLIGAIDSCWVLEDFHKVPDSEKTKISQIMKVFMDAADEYPSVKIIAIGAVSTARQVIQYDVEMTNRVAEVNVPLMDKGQIKSIIIKGQDLLNFEIPARHARDITNYSGGLAAVCHQLCLNICNAAGIRETCSHPERTNSSHLKKAVERYLADSSDTLKLTFDKALYIKRMRKYDNCRLILEAITSASKETFTRNEILHRIRRKHETYPTNNFNIYIKQLQTEDRGAVVSFDPIAKRYYYSNPLYRAYALLKFNQKNNIEIKVDSAQFVETLKKLLTELEGNDDTGDEP